MSFPIPFARIELNESQETLLPFTLYFFLVRKGKLKNERYEVEYFLDVNRVIEADADVSVVFTHNLFSQERVEGSQRSAEKMPVLLLNSCLQSIDCITSSMHYTEEEVGLNRNFQLNQLFQIPRCPTFDKILSRTFFLFFPEV